MWALWGSSPPAAPEVSAGTLPAASSSPSLSASSSAIVTFPQWRLISTISRKASGQLSKYPAKHIYASVATTLALTVTITFLARHLVHRRGDHVRGGRPISAASVLPCDAATGSDCAVGKLGCVDGAKTAPVRCGAEDGGDDIEFADPVESAFVSYVRRVKQQKEAPFLAALAYLEAAAAELAELRRMHGNHDSFGREEGGEGGEGCNENSSDAHGSNIDNGGSRNDFEDRGAVAEAQAKVHRLAVVADELLTQWICSLDGVPVRQSETLKQRRKALVQEAASLTQRISPHLPDMGV
ncbi:hypothetical protein, conserved [Leishmania tarentolae]|uniref:BAG domain-containing protein n=1 Tax=Leishmania tarentolae TaxID=5689 RepID=A0A640KLK7_LEITA|nr:hypothetical protein, conserved [Leishmania tarentolae]